MNLSDLVKNLKTAADQKFQQFSQSPVGSFTNSFAKPVAQFGTDIGNAIRSPLDLYFQNRANQTYQNLQNNAMQSSRVAQHNGFMPAARSLANTANIAGQSQANNQINFGQNLQNTQRRIIPGAVQTGLTLAAGSAGLPAIALNAVIGGGLNAVFGDKSQPVSNRFGEGGGSSVKYAGFGLAFKPFDALIGSQNLAGRTLLKTGANLAEQGAYIKATENRGMTKNEAIINTLLPAISEIAPAAWSKLRAGKAPEIAIKQDPQGFIIDSNGAYRDPITMKFVSTPKEIAVAKVNQVKAASSGLMPKPGDTLVDMGGGKWVFKSTLDQYKSTVDTPKLSVEPTGASTPIMITRDMRQQLMDRGYTKQQIGKLRPDEAWKILRPSVEPVAQGGLSNVKGTTTAQTQLPKTELQTPSMFPEVQKPVSSLDTILSLPQGDIKTYSPAQAKQKFKQSGRLVPIETRLKPNETPVTIPGGGVTGKQLYQEGTPITEKQAIDQWDKSIADYANGITRTKGGVLVESTKKTNENISNKNTKIDVNNQKKLDNEWQKAVFGEANARTTKQAEKDLAKAIKTSTNEASFNLNTADNWKDKNMLSLGRETMDRNFEDVMGSQAPEMKRKLLDPIYKAEADRNRFLNKEGADIRSLGIKDGSKESALVQLYGEGKITAGEVKQQSPNADKIIHASDVLRQKYDTYLGQLNKALTRNGYDPIPKRSDYFHHFQELTGLFDQVGVAIKANDLPTDINGLTADFKPGKTFFTAALQRKGDQTATDAIGGILKYLEGASNQIYHTDNIQALRAFETAIRERYAGTTHLNNFVANLGEYTNSLAGKKGMIDRAAEALVGRKIYSAANTLKSQVGGNMVGANVSSSLTNYIPLTQALATTDKASFLQAMLSTIKNVFKNDGFAENSDFLTTRKGSPILTKNLWQKTSEKAGWLFQSIDNFVSQIVTRSKYLEAIKNGASEDQAMKTANDWARKTIGGRGKGEMPTLFNSKTLGFLTQFQLEVNNQISFMAKDIPRNFDKLGAASATAQLFLYGYLFNNLYQNITGRRPAFDPIGVAQQAYQDYTNPDMKAGQATKNLAGNVINQLPFVSITSGGRIPIGSAIPNPFAVTSGNSTWGQELSKPLQFVLPTGGGQIRKTKEGLTAYNQGASTTKNGNVRFTIAKTPANLARTALFGQYSTPEATKYFRNGDLPLNDKQSATVLGSKTPPTQYAMIKGQSANNAKIDSIKQEVLSTGGEKTYNGVKYYVSSQVKSKTGESKPIVKSIKVSQSIGELYSELPQKYETSPDSPKNILSKVAVYGTGIFKDPNGTISAIKSGNPIRKVNGDAVVLERLKNLSSLDQGDITTEVDHIIANTLGGSNDESNLQVISKQDNRAKGIVDTWLSDQLKAGTIKKAEAQARDLNWRTEINNLPSNKKAEANVILASKPVVETAKSTGILSDLSQRDFKVIKTVSDKGVVSYSNVTIKIPEAPTYTGKTELDKQLKSKYSSSLSTVKTNITKLYMDGQITPDEANKALNELNTKKTSTAKAKKGSFKIKKITFKTPKITIKKTRMAKIKAPKALKIASIKQPKKLKIASVKIPKIKYKLA